MPMELGTFGAILGYAIDLEDRAAAFYKEAARGELSEPFEVLAAGAAKRRIRLLRARQELVSEMILESITGLDGDAYRVGLEPEAGQAEALAQGLRLERTAARFYRDAAAKMPIREVVRLFKRLAQENDRRRDRVEAFAEAAGL